MSRTQSSSPCQELEWISICEKGRKKDKDRYNRGYSLVVAHLKHLVTERRTYPKPKTAYQL